MKKILFALAVIIFAAPALLADTIFLKNGQKIEGRIIAENENEITLRIADIGSMTFKRNEIKKITRDRETGEKYVPSSDEEAVREKEKARMEERRLEEEKNIARPPATPSTETENPSENAAAEDTGAPGENASETGGEEAGGEENIENANLDQLIFNLGHNKKPGLRIAAREKLAAMGAKVIDKLTPLLYNSNNWRAQNAAWALGRIGDKKALKALQEAQASGAGNEWVQKEISDAIDLINQKNPVETGPNPAEPIYQRGLKKEEAGDYKGAMDEYKAAVARSSAFGPAWVALAVRHINEYKLREAGLELVNSTRLDPAYADYVSKYNLADKADPPIKDEVAVYTDAIRDNASNADAFIRRGIFRAFGGENASAVADMESAVKLRPDDLQTLYYKGFVRQLTGNLSGAIEDYSELIKKSPRMARAYISRAQAYALSKNLDNALEDFNTAVEIAPRSAVAFNGRGNLFAAAKLFDNAIEDYDQAIDIDPEFAFAYANRADAKSGVKDWPGAIADYTEAIKRLPDDAAAYEMRGRAKRQIGDDEGAQADMQKAAELKKK